MKQSVKRVFQQVGLDIRRRTPLTSVPLRRLKLMEREAIDVVVDVGANVGQYARALRRSGFSGRIISIEPQPLAFERLKLIAGQDRLWTCERVALADSEGDAVLHIARNSVSSSLLPMTDYMASAFAQAETVSQEIVKRTTLESVFEKFGISGRVYLKIDAQGYEQQVLDGCCGVMSRIPLIETELALRPMYRNGSSFGGVLKYLTDMNYCLVSVEPNTTDPATEHIVEVNAIFARPN